MLFSDLFISTREMAKVSGMNYFTFPAEKQREFTKKAVQ